MRTPVSRFRAFLAALRLPARAWRGATRGVVTAAALCWATISAYGFAPAGPLPFALGLFGGLLGGREGLGITWERGYAYVASEDGDNPHGPPDPTCFHRRVYPWVLIRPRMAHSSPSAASGCPAGLKIV